MLQGAHQLPSKGVCEFYYIEDQKCKMSHENNSLTFHYASCLIGTLLMVYIIIIITNIPG